MESGTSSPSQSATALVTGAGGFLGLHLARHLFDAGYRVRASDLPRCDFSELKRLGAEASPSDILNFDSIRSVMTGVDTVFHLAAIFDLGAPSDLMWRVNVEGTRNVCRAAVEAGVRRFVMLSSTAIYGHPSELPCPETGEKRARDPYGRTKWESEKVAMQFGREQGLSVVAVRPTLVYGPRSRYGQALYFAMFGIHRALARARWPMWTMPMANQVHVEDVCRAIIFLAKRTEVVEEAFNVSDDEPQRLDEAFQILLGKYGIQPLWVRAAWFPPFARVMCRLLSKFPQSFFNPINRWVQGHWDRVVRKYDLRPELKPRLDRDWLDYLSTDRVYDNRKIKSLGFEFRVPRSSLGLAEVFEWYKRERWIPDLGPLAEERTVQQKVA